MILVYQFIHTLKMQQREGWNQEVESRSAMYQHKGDEECHEEEEEK